MFAESFLLPFLHFPFLLLNYLLITPWILRLLNAAHQTLTICQRSFWLLQFVQLQIAPIVQTCSWLLMWCAKAPMEQPLLESTTQEQQVSRRPVGCFHKLEELLLQFGIPLWAGYLLVLPSGFCNTVLLWCATEITPAGGTCCLWGFFKVPGHY